MTSRRRSWYGCVFACLVLSLSTLGGTNGLSRSSRATDSNRRSNVGGHHPAQVNEAYGRVPLHFEANRGQTDDRVKFVTRGRGYTMFLTGNEIVLALDRPRTRKKEERHLLRRMTESQEPTDRTVLRMSFVGANPSPRVEGRDELPGKANYFRGNDPSKWRTNVPTYARVHYADLYPGIDLVYYGNQSQLEYDFIVRPGADPGRLALDFKGAEKIEVDADGDLVLHTARDAIRQRKPVIYQEVDGARREIAGDYVLRGDHLVGIHVARYDASRPLVIDPVVLFYSTYLGGTGVDSGGAVAVDGTGNAYVVGTTASADFPTTAGAAQSASGGSYDAFVTKLNPTGSGLVYSTYLGGGSDDGGGAVAVDTSGQAYVSGGTASIDFPTTAGAYDTSFNGGADAFITKLNSTGSVLMYSTYVGGGGSDFVSGMALDATGSAYVGGSTSSADFPATPLAFDTVFNGGDSDAFAAKLNPTGSMLVYATFVGGTDYDSLNGVALDAAGDAYIVGITVSSDYPTTAGAFDTTFNGGFGDYDAFVTKLVPTGSALAYSTFLGGSDVDSASRIAVDMTGNAFIGGTTASINFPTTPGSFQTTWAGLYDIFITKLNLTGSTLVYSTYLGGSSDDIGGSLTLDGTGNTYVTGTTFSTDFPITPAVFQGTFAGDQDVFVTKVNSTGSGLVYSSYLGGSGGEGGQEIALDAFATPNAYVIGYTTSTDFPTTPGAFQGAGDGNFDAFVTKIAEGNPQGGPFTARVTGGGTVNVDAVGGIGSFSFMIARSSNGSLSGHLQYFNHASGSHVRGDTYTSLMIVGNTATFDGTCTVNGTPCTFTVKVIDNGEPGTTDSFEISISGDPAEGGVLRSGNILIRQE